MQSKSMVAWRVKLPEAGRIDVIRQRNEEGGVLGGRCWDGALHRKKVLPTLRILSTDARHYHHLLSFKFILGLKHMEAKLTRSLIKSWLKKEVFI